MFCSDPLSSVAYATEEILLVLGLGGVALLHLSVWLAAAVVVLLIVVVASYRQTCYAYPNGGGAYAVSKDNLGEDAALVAASALLIDYVLTVAVSVVAGVAAITSAAPALTADAVWLSLAFVIMLTVVNLRGIKESGRLFAVPTYGFVAAVYLMLAFGFAKVLFGAGVTAESAHHQLRQVTQTGGLLTVFLALRAFASGCTALTGVEAISNGVPAFRPPKSRNAAGTLVAMGALATTMFAGITALALLAHVHMRRARPAAHGAQPGGAGQLRPGAALLPAAGVHRGDPRAGGQHGVQRLPGAGLDPRPRRLPAAPALAPRRPARVLQRDRPAGRRRLAADRGLRRPGQPADPALHPRRVPVVHAQPARHGPALAAGRRDAAQSS